MRYLSLSIGALVLAQSLLSGKAGSVDVAVEADVRLGGSNVSIGFFNDHLAPHGKWIEVATYGRVWQPAVVLTEQNWRPYVNEGRWRYTDSGWYWDSTYAWGWATFHYGRWSYDDQYKWVWLPDVTWGPAWVSWRQSDSVYGWAPLPFGSRFEGGVFVGGSIELRADLFNFVPASGFLSVSLGSVVYPPAQASTIYKQTTIVNNSYVYNDNRVINNGIPVAQVATATKQEIKPVAVADAKSPAEKSSPDGKIAAYRPAIKDEKAKTGTPPSKAGSTPPTDVPVPAVHETKEQEKNPNSKAPDAKAGEKAPEAKVPEQAPEANAGEKAPKAKAPEQAPEAKANEKEPQGEEREKKQEGKAGEKGKKTNIQDEKGHK